MALARFKDLCIDAGDPAGIAGFWSALFDRRAAPKVTRR